MCDALEKGVCVCEYYMKGENMEEKNNVDRRMVKGNRRFVL
jgi:hypothetical protein